MFGQFFETEFKQFSFRSEQNGNKYNEILVDFRYFKDPEGFENKINGNDVSNS